MDELLTIALMLSIAISLIAVIGVGVELWRREKFLDARAAGLGLMMKNHAIRMSAARRKTNG